LTDERQPRGFEEYRAHVGPSELYDLSSAVQFTLLCALGLRDEHSLLDVGCGSLKAGRLFIPYLRPDRYFGIEHLSWLIEEGIAREIGQDLVRIKRPTFSNDNDWTMSIFNRQFDYILAQSIFSHLPSDQIRRCVAEAKKALKPTGVFAASFFLGLRNYDGHHWAAKADYTLPRMCELVAAEGMVCTAIDWQHPDPQQWILIHHPGTVAPLARVTDDQQLELLTQQLAQANTQLMSIRSHPVMRIGAKVKFALMWVPFLKRHVERLVRDRLSGRQGGRS
jgi:SAM-dependent methyltransferase